MKHNHNRRFVCSALSLLFWASLANAQEKTIYVAFQDTQVGQLPQGWKAEGTRQKGALATWKVQADSSAPSKPNVLALTSPNHSSNRTFNLCWTNQIQFKDGQIELSFKAVSGSVDRGGGPIWRVRDKDNYYVCRANPLEDNLRLYYVKGGRRRQIATAEDVIIASGKWHTIKVIHEGDHIQCFFNGKKLIDHRDDTFESTGGVGLWTKADAATAFDDFAVTSK